MLSSLRSSMIGLLGAATLLFWCCSPSSSSPGAPSSTAPPSLPVISVRDRSLLVDGTPFLVRGIAYAPVPIGHNPSEFLPAEPRIYERDFPLLRASGVNTLRTYAMIPSPDLGILSVAPSTTGGVDDVSPRAAFARLQQEWVGPVTITAPVSGTVRQTERVTGTFESLQPGDTILVVVRNRLDRLYPQSFPFTASSTTGTWSAAAFFGDPGRNHDDRFDFFALASRDASLTAQLVAIGKAGGTAAFPKSSFLV